MGPACVFINIRLVGVIVMNVVAFLWIAGVPGLWPHKKKQLTRKT